jgi:hypothetical protein
MAALNKTAGLIAVLAAVAACSTDASSVTSGQAVEDTRAAGKPPPTRSVDHPTGGTESGAGGSVSGGMTHTPEPQKEQQRGNTPPGMDRDGHGPASGAIVDPTGAATQRKPF